MQGGKLGGCCGEPAFKPAVRFERLEDFGFFPNSRRRQWRIAVSREWGSFVRDPARVYKELMDATSSELRVDPMDSFWLTDQDLLNKEKKMVKKRATSTKSLPQS